MITKTNFRYLKLALGTAAIAASASSALATLNYDLRATALNGVALDASHAKGALDLPLLPGDVVTLTVYAQITGLTAGNFEGMGTGFYTLNAPTSGFNSGGFENAAIVPAFATGAFNKGTLVDTNADGVFDQLGGKRTASAQGAAPFDITVRAGSTPNYNGTPIGSGATAGQEWALSTVDFRISALGGGLGGTIALFPSIFTGGIGAARFSGTWAEDTAGGVVGSNRVSGFNGYTPAANAANTGTITFSSLTFTLVPEPSAFGMVLLGAMGLVGFRRLGLRRS